MCSVLRITHICGHTEEYNFQKKYAQLRWLYSTPCKMCARKETSYLIEDAHEFLFYVIGDDVKYIAEWKRKQIERAIQNAIELSKTKSAKSAANELKKQLQQILGKGGLEIKKSQNATITYQINIFITAFLDVIRFEE